MKKPKVGIPVLFFPRKEDNIARSNGNEGPVAAIITQVWSDICVNLKIFPDHGAVQDRGSVTHKSMNPATYSWCYLDESEEWVIEGHEPGKVATLQA